MHLYPWRLAPVFKEKVWGGRRMADVLAKGIPDGAIGESWECSDRDGDTTPIANGPLAGRPIGEVMAAARDDFLGPRLSARPPGRFPLLVKFIDASDRLSVQVHPGDAAAARLEPGGDPGKTEAWYVLHADPGARIWRGLRGGTDRARFEAMLAAGRIEECLRSFEPKAGDCVFLPAGTVHAMGGGLLVLEVQQNSDTTYRVWDWGRPRQTHVAKALQVIDWSPPMSDTHRSVTIAAGPLKHDRLIACDRFTMDRWDAGVPAPLPDADSPRVVTLTRGRGRVVYASGSEPCRAGDTFLFPAALHGLRIEPEAEIEAIVATPA